jgi:hypothetical protein
MCLLWSTNWVVISQKTTFFYIRDSRASWWPAATARVLLVFPCPTLAPTLWTRYCHPKWQTVSEIHDVKPNLTGAITLLWSCYCTRFRPVFQGNQKTYCRPWCWWQHVCTFICLVHLTDLPCPYSVKDANYEVWILAGLCSSRDMPTAAVGAFSWRSVGTAFSSFWRSVGHLCQALRPLVLQRTAGNCKPVYQILIELKASFPRRFKMQDLSCKYTRDTKLTIMNYVRQ